MTVSPTRTLPDDRSGECRSTESRRRRYHLQIPGRFDFDGMTGDQEAEDRDSAFEIDGAIRQSVAIRWPGDARGSRTDLDSMAAWQFMSTRSTVAIRSSLLPRSAMAADIWRKQPPSGSGAPPKNSGDDATASCLAGVVVGGGGGGGGAGRRESVQRSPPTHAAE